MGLTDGLVKHCVKNHLERTAVSPDGQGTAADAKRIKELEKQLANLTMERDILKKAMAVFSLDPDQSSSS